MFYFNERERERERQEERDREKERVDVSQKEIGRKTEGKLFEQKRYRYVSQTKHPILVLLSLCLSFSVSLGNVIAGKYFLLLCIYLSIYLFLSLSHSLTRSLSLSHLRE